MFEIILLGIAIWLQLALIVWLLVLTFFGNASAANGKKNTKWWHELFLNSSMFIMLLAGVLGSVLIVKFYLNGFGFYSFLWNIIPIGYFALFCYVYESMPSVYGNSE